MNIWTNPYVDKWLKEDSYDNLKNFQSLLDQYTLPGGYTTLGTQVGGDHYTKLEIQPWEYIEANKLDFWEGNVVKYITRKKGNRLEDLKKARHYIDYLIERESK